VPAAIDRHFQGLLRVALFCAPIHHDDPADPAPFPAPTANGYFKCVRDHLFKIELIGGKRVAVVERDAPEEGGCMKGDQFPVPEDETF
jgi:hypothetical protein